MTDHHPPDDPVLDRDLLARLDRDTVAFETFYRRYVGRITGFAVRRCDSPDEAADLVAAVFLAVIESAHRYDPDRGEPISWLFGVAANQLRTQRRRSWRQRGLPARIPGQQLLADDDIVRLEERIDAERLAPEVRRAIARLPRGERAVFDLVSREGLTPAQAARSLAISPTAVRVRLSRARAKLRVDLGEALDRDPRSGAVRPVRPTNALAAATPKPTEEMAL